MIFIGNDIVEVSRIDALLKKYQKRFLDRSFSKNEIRIVSSKRHQSIHYSGKFSAKEASRKALLSAGVGSDIYIKDIEILNKENGAPYIEIKKINMNLIKNFQITISHTNFYATAFALLEL
tara:strand:+ start:164 stop:526 length:363 start_codon:yes stop_codon:yes gene_type:complete